jgi:hypothetical protein
VAVATHDDQIRIVFHSDRHDFRGRLAETLYTLAISQLRPRFCKPFIGCLVSVFLHCYDRHVGRQGALQ